MIHCEVEGWRWPLADPLILTYEAWCLTVKRQCHVHSDSHNLALNSNFKPRDGAEEGGPAIRIKKESRVENYNLFWFLILHYIDRGVRPSLPLSCVTESAIIFYYELYLKYFRNKTWQCQRRVNKGRDGGGFTSACSAGTRDGPRSASVTCSRKVSNVVHHFLKISQKLCHFQTSKNFTRRRVKNIS